jgi:hypothetical protein
VPARDTKPRSTSSIAVGGSMIGGRTKRHVDDNLVELTDRRRHTCGMGAELTELRRRLTA